MECSLAAMPDAKVFGVSVMPIRYPDSFRNMVEELFDGNYAVNMSLAEAIQRKILMPIYYFLVLLFQRYCKAGNLCGGMQKNIRRNTKNPLQEHTIRTLEKIIEVHQRSPVARDKSNWAMMFETEEVDGIWKTRPRTAQEIPKCSCFGYRRS